MNETPCPIHDTMVKLFENEFKNINDKVDANFKDINGKIEAIHESIKEISQRQKTDAEKNAEAALAALNAVNIYKARKQGEEEGKDATITEIRILRGQRNNLITIIISILAILTSIGVAIYYHSNTKDEISDVKKSVGPHFNKRGEIFYGLDSTLLLKKMYQDTTKY